MRFRLLAEIYIYIHRLSESIEEHRMNRSYGWTFVSRISEAHPASKGKRGHQRYSLRVGVRRLDKYQLNITYNME